ncbi:MAG: 2-dehydro-3-deoxygalactonokinase [Vibrio sp.]|uniref:2-dehydro-3-deoxygalactonokinase n=1 Tax=Vibrio sp. TaxID=678 RepID=UPI003A881A93
MIIPGTHSKVVSIEDGFVVDFKTFLTGEMFYALCESTILGTFGKNVDPNSEWFYQGVIRGAKSKHSGDLLSLLFCARSRVLVDNMPEDQSASFISGLLLGSEIGASQYKTQDIWVMGNGNL